MARNAMIGSGERLRSKSRRRLSPVPTINTHTERSTRATLARVATWLVEEARAEARATRDDWAATLLRGCNPRNLSQSDMDTLNHFLFGDVDGPGPEHREAPHPSLFE
jgi:hypothetical protein